MSASSSMKADSAPLISVLMSVHNGSAYLRSALDSILNQTFRNFELIVVDDGSTDDTPKILARVSDPRLRILVNEQNIGLTKSLNRALTAAQGELVARQDADDISHPERFARQVNFLDRHPEVGVLGSELVVCDAEGRPAGAFGVATRHAAIVWRMFHGRTFAHTSVMFRTRIVRSIGGYDPRITVAQDFDLWTRLVELTRFANLPQPLVRYHSHPGAISRVRADAQRQVVLSARRSLLSRVLERDFSIEDTVTFEKMLSKPERTAGRNIGLVREVIGGLEEKGILSLEDITEITCGFRPPREGGGREGPDVGSPFRMAAGLANRVVRSRRPKSVIVAHAGGPLGAQRPTGAGAKGVTLVILTYGRVKGLHALLDSLALQDLGDLRLEIIICNNATDRRLTSPWRWRLRRQLERLPDTKILDSNYNWACSIRYALATMAKYDAVLFIDDDIVLRSPTFIQHLYSQFTLLGPRDILSCWTTIWADWNDATFSTVSLTFRSDGVHEMVEVDTIGPGISMFHRDTVIHPEVLRVVMSPMYPKADDMGFSIAASTVHKSRKFFMPSHGMIDFHEQSKRTPLALRSGHYDDLYAFYKYSLANGFEPLLSRQARERPGQVTAERHLADNLTRQTFEW